MHIHCIHGEQVSLKDGARALLRPVRPDDKERLRAILRGLSPRSRMNRFFVARRDFTAEELRYLTELDGVNHFALLASVGDDSVGVARFVRLADVGGGRVAEPAFAVVDRWQRRGLGRILVARLAAAARERGIESFRAEVLASNDVMLRLLGELDGSRPLRAVRTTDSVTCTVALGAGVRSVDVAQPSLAG